MANPQMGTGYTPVANEILEALARTRIAGEARQMLDVIIRKTYGFHKKEDRISTSQFVGLTGLSNQAVHKNRKKLLDMNLITVTKKGNGQILTYSFQKDYDKWRAMPKKGSIAKKFSRPLSKKEIGYIPKSDANIQNILNTKDSNTKYIAIDEAHMEIIKEVIKHLNAQTGKEYRWEARDNQNIIAARLNEGYSKEDLKKVIDNQCDQWLHDEKMAVFLRPATLFASDKIEGYLNADKRRDPWESYRRDRS